MFSFSLTQGGFLFHTEEFWKKRAVGLHVGREVRVVHQTTRTASVSQTRCPSRLSPRCMVVAAWKKATDHAWQAAVWALCVQGAGDRSPGAACPTCRTVLSTSAVVVSAAPQGTDDRLGLL